MAKSKYEYVRSFEQPDVLLPECFIVVRIDGKGFTKFSDLHGFTKPNDLRALELMNEAAKAVLEVFPDIRLAYGESDEYSFVLHRQSNLYERRSSKLVSLVTSCFTSNYVRMWPSVMGDSRQLKASPMFDGRTVLYPTEKVLRDYFSWRQVDTHINNQYNTCFWALVQQGSRTPAQAQAELKGQMKKTGPATFAATMLSMHTFCLLYKLSVKQQGTDANFKNNLLFESFGINYNELPDIYKKGSIVLRERSLTTVKHDDDGKPVQRLRTSVVVKHCDIIQDDPFWIEHPDLLT